MMPRSSGEPMQTSVSLKESLAKRVSKPPMKVAAKRAEVSPARAAQPKKAQGGKK